LTGTVEPFEAGRQVWYSAAPFEIAYSWALPIGLASSLVFLAIIGEKLDLRNLPRFPERIKSNWVLTVAITGILFLGSALVLRSSYGGWRVRYFYPFYLLLMPACITVIGKIVSKKRLISTAILVFLIAIASFYAMQDVALSPQTDILLQADRRTWTIAETLAATFSSDAVGSLAREYLMDARVAIPFQALALESMPKLYYEGGSQISPRLIVVSFDRLGTEWASSYLEDQDLAAIKDDSYSVVYTDGLYRGFSVPSGG